MENLPFLMLRSRMDSLETRQFTQAYKHKCICVYSELLTQCEEKKTHEKQEGLVNRATISY